MEWRQAGLFVRVDQSTGLRADVPYWRMGRWGFTILAQRSNVIFRMKKNKNILKKFVKSITLWYLSYPARPPVVYKIHTITGVKISENIFLHNTAVHCLGYKVKQKLPANLNFNAILQTINNTSLVKERDRRQGPKYAGGTPLHTCSWLSSFFWCA